MDIKPFGVCIDAPNYRDALEQLREWLDTQPGNKKGIKVEVADNKTTVTLDDGRVGVARCCPEDKFDVVTGIRVALDNLEKKYRKLTELENEILKLGKLTGATHIRFMDWGEDGTSVELNNDDGHDDVVYVYDTPAFKWLDDGEYYSIDQLLKEHC